MGTAPAELHAIVINGSSPKLSTQLPVPPGAQRLYLPPRQQYALVELNTGAPLAVWALHREVSRGGHQELVYLAGAMSNPDLVSFSPRGDAAVLYSQTSGDLQLVGQFPLRPTISRAISVPRSETVSRIAVSDDAEVVIAEMSDGSTFISSKTDTWKALHIAYSAQVFLFIPRTHDLLVSDTSQKTIALLPHVDEGSSPTRLLAQTVLADQLAVSKDGNEVLAANGANSQLWVIDMKSGSVTPRNEEATKLGTLALLRDGFTFALSTTPRVSLLNSNAAPDPRTGAPSASY
jgi:DNA-binding beta-propeller fold protein YncE